MLVPHPRSRPVPPYCESETEAGAYKSPGGGSRQLVTPDGQKVGRQSCGVRGVRNTVDLEVTQSWVPILTVPLTSYEFGQDIPSL